MLVEKILEPGEDLPTDWATAGTTGYDVLGDVDRVLVDPDGEEPLLALDARLRDCPPAARRTGTPWCTAPSAPWPTASCTREVRRVVRELLRERPALAEQTDGGEAAILDAVAELMACFAVYRSYLPRGPRLGREHLEAALAAAREHRPDLAGVLDAARRPARRPRRGRRPGGCQQTSGMVMAKGVEDCAFYRWSPLTSLNEVGGDPSEFSLSPRGLPRPRWPRRQAMARTR